MKYNFHNEENNPYYKKEIQAFLSDYLEKQWYLGYNKNTYWRSVLKLSLVLEFLPQEKML